MDDVTELQGRITAALDRIRAGLDHAAPAAADDSGDLRAQLDEERTANAQLEERVRVLKDRQDTKVNDLERRVAQQQAQLSELDAALQRMTAANADLRALTATLREAAMDGVAEPDLINRATIAELDATRAARAAEATEVEAILSELRPLVTEDDHATG